MKLCRRKDGFVVLALISGLLGAHAGRASAQAGIEIGPVAGYYRTHGSTHGNEGPNVPGNFSAPAYGGELSIWGNGRFGVQAQGAIAWSNHQEYANPGGFTPQESGHIDFGSVAALYAVYVSKPTRLWISAGPGFVGYRGDAFQPSGEPTETAAVLGIGETQLIHNSFALTLGVSTLLYQYAGIFGDIGGPPTMDGTPRSKGTRETRSRSDLLFHVAIALNGHS